MAIRINPYAGMNQGGGDWIDLAREIRLAKEELRKYEGIMTAYERQTVSESIQAKKDNYHSRIYQGAAADLNQAKKQYQGAVEARKKAQAQEITSWDAGKLGQEMNTFQMRVNQAMGSHNGGTMFNSRTPAVDQVNNLYQEAMASGDRYKQRAAAEVMRSINTESLPKETALPLNILGNEAETTLSKLRTTPEMQTAAEGVKTAAKTLQGSLELVGMVADLLGENTGNIFGFGPFTKLLKTVQTDPKTGEPRFFDIDSPEVTGIHTLPPKEVYPKEE